MREVAILKCETYIGASDGGVLKIYMQVAMEPTDEINQSKSSAFGGHYSFASQHIVLNMPDSVIDRLNGTSDYDDIEDTKLYTSYRHEFTHFVQNVTTSYGIWKTFVLRIAAFSLWAAQSFAVEAGVDVPRRKEDIDKFRNSTGSQTRLQKAIFFFRSEMASVSFLEGNYKFPPNYNFAQIKPPRAATHPRVETAAARSVLTASTLLEYQAYVQQLVGLFHTRGIPDHHAEVLKSQIIQYPSFRQPQNTIAWAFQNNFPSAPALTELTYELVTLALSPEWPSGLLASVLVGSDEIKPSRQSIPWEHIHPGWRLVRIAEAIRSERLTFPDRIATPPFIARLCKILRWWKPQRSRKRLLLRIRSEELGRHSMGDLIENAADVDLMIARTRGCSIDYLDAMVSNPVLKRMVRGPIPVYEGLNMPIILGELNVQRFYSERPTCPVCFAVNHRDPCPVKFLQQGGVHAPYC